MTTTRLFFSTFSPTGFLVTATGRVSEVSGHLRSRMALCGPAGFERVRNDLSLNARKKNPQFPSVKPENFPVFVAGNFEGEKGGGIWDLSLISINWEGCRFEKE